MAKDTSHYFISFLQEFIGYETEISHPAWQTLKHEYYKCYCTLMQQISSLQRGRGMHIYSILPKQYAEDNVTLMINPDIDALLTFCISLHEMGLYTEWTSTVTNWLVFVHRK